MPQNIPSLQKLVRQLQKFPYLASKNLYRVALFLLSSDDSFVELFFQSIREFRNNVKFCTICFNLSEKTSLCRICLNQSRHQEIICVVETWHDLIAIERTGEYGGAYHVLGGAICPLEGIGPENLNLQSLLQRIKSGVVKELILATSFTPEGDATSSYIVSKLGSNVDIIVSKIATGIPIGTVLSFVDNITLTQALAGRRPY